MKQQNNLLLIIAITAMLVLPACSSVKRDLGIARNSPDEFLVVKRAPLTLPPDYALRPPVEKTEVNKDILKDEAPNIAKATLLGKNNNSVVTGSADKTFLNKAGASFADKDIRKQIDKDNGYIYLKNRTMIDKLTSSDNENVKLDKMPTSVVDPIEESKRIKKNLSEGKPINEGDIPVIEKKESTLDKLF